MPFTLACGRRIRQIEREGLRALGEPSWARYDPPYEPWFLRTNEISIEVA